MAAMKKGVEKIGSGYAVAAAGILSYDEFSNDHYSGQIGSLISKRVGFPVKIGDIDSSHYASATIYFNRAKKCAKCGKKSEIKFYKIPSGPRDYRELREWGGRA